MINIVKVNKNKKDTDKINSLIKNKIKEIKSRFNIYELYNIKEIADRQEYNYLYKALESWISAKRKNRFENVRLKKIMSEEAYLIDINILIVKRTLQKGIRDYKEDDKLIEEYLPVSLYELPFKSPPAGFNEGKELEQKVPGSDDVGICRSCHGQGSVVDSPENQECNVCKGKGKIVEYEYCQTKYSPEFLNYLFSSMNIPENKLGSDSSEYEYVYDEIITDNMEDVEEAWLKLQKFNQLYLIINELIDYIREFARIREDISVFRIGLKIRRAKLKRIEYWHKNRKHLLWMIGNKNRIYERDIIFNWRRIFPVAMASAFVFTASMLFSTKMYFIDDSMPNLGGNVFKGLVIKKIPAESYGKDKPVKNVSAVSRKYVGQKSQEVKKTKSNDVDIKINSLYRRGITKLEAGETENAYNDFNKAIRLMKNRNNSDSLIVDLYFSMGETLMKFENYDGAITAYEKVLEVNPRHKTAEEKISRAKTLKEIYEKN